MKFLVAIYVLYTSFASLGDEECEISEQHPSWRLLAQSQQWKHKNNM